MANTLQDANRSKTDYMSGDAKVISGFDRRETQPKDVATDLDLYVQSNVTWGDGGLYATTTDCGDDANDGLSSSKPMLSLDGLYRRYRHATQGMRVIVHLMGGGPEPVDSPTSGRTYYSPNVYVGGGEAWRNTWIYRGPRNMLALGATRTLSSSANVSNGSYSAGRTKLTFSGSFTAASYSIRWTRTDGREVIFPFPCSENDVDGVSVYTEVLAKESFDSISAIGGGNNFTPVQPAVFITARGGDTQFNSVFITGQGAHRPGDRLGDVAPTFDHNPFPVFERIAFSRPVFAFLGAGYVDACHFHDHAYVAPGCRPGFRSCVSEGFLHHEGGAHYLTNGSQYTSGEHTMGRMLTFDSTQALSSQRYTGVSDPDDMTAAQDICITGQGAGMVIGRDVGGDGGHFRVQKGISVCLKEGGTVGIRLYGPNASLWVGDVGRLCVIGNATNNTGIWAVDGARVRVNDSTAAGVYCGPRFQGITSNHYRVGTTAAFASGTGAGGLCEVAGKAGNALSATDYSRIWDMAFEPANYGAGT